MVCCVSASHMLQVHETKMLCAVIVHIFRCCIASDGITEEMTGFLVKSQLLYSQASHPNNEFEKLFSPLIQRQKL